MNIEVKIVTHQGAWSGALPDTPAGPRRRADPRPRAHSLPGWVISYGIAPYSSTRSLPVAPRSQSPRSKTK